MGRRQLSFEEISGHFTGVALEIWPNATFRAIEDRQRVRLVHLFRSISGLGKAMLHLLALSVAIEVFTLLLPIGTQLVTDQVIVASDHSLLVVIMLALGLLVMLKAVMRFVRSWTIMVVATNLKVQLSSSLFDRLIRLPVDYFEKRHIGDIVSRFTSLNEIQRSVTANFVTALIDGVMTIGLLVVMVLYGGWLAAIAVATSLIYALARAGTYVVYRQASEEEIVYGAKRDTHLIETVRGISTLKMFDLSERRRAGWINHVVDTTNAEVRTERLDIAFQSATTLLFGADRILMLYLGASAIIAGQSSIGMLLAFLAYKDDFAGRIENLINTTIEFRMLLPASRRTRVGHRSRRDRG